MPISDTIHALLAAARQPADRKAARAAWVKRTAAAWRAAHRELDDLLDEAVELLDEADFERLCEAEFARVDAMMAQLRAAADEDRWPRELYWGGI
ncbi:MAG: hypothetical protein ACJ8D5_02505 [Sphingomicrobium sp.]